MTKNKTSPVIIYLIGKAGTGKYTISKELAKFGYIICDNQLINNPIFELLNYDGYAKIPGFAWEAISQIRANVFKFLEEEKNNNYVLTNELNDDEGDHRLFQQVQTMAQHRGSLFFPVKLLISKEEHLKRIVVPERKLRWKTIDPEHVYSKVPLININHPNLLTLDVTTLSAKEAAEKILCKVDKLVNSI